MSSVSSLSRLDDISIPLDYRLVESLEGIPGDAGRKGFFPEKTLSLLINKNSVQRELEKCFTGILDSRTIKDHAESICGRAVDGVIVSFKKIFAILILCEKPSSVQLFIAEGVTDADLPLRKVYCCQGESKLFDLARTKSTLGNDSKPLECFKDWSPLAIRRFEEWQWTTQTPFFHRGERKNVARFVFQPDIPLPFTSDSRYSQEQGGYFEVESGFSSVFKVDIHPEQHGFHGYKVRSHHSRSRLSYLYGKLNQTFYSSHSGASPSNVSLLGTEMSLNMRQKC